MNKRERRIIFYHFKRTRNQQVYSITSPSSRKDIYKVAIHYIPNKLKHHTPNQKIWTQMPLNQGRTASDLPPGSGS